MGGMMQPQGHLQVLAGMIDHDLNPQAALDQPRWLIHGVDSFLGPESVAKDKSKLLLEEGVPEETKRRLEAAGHRCELVKGWGRMVFGRGQVICRNNETGVLVGGTEPRADGA